jgi:hypothetical protein
VRRFARGLRGFIGEHVAWLAREHRV